MPTTFAELVGKLLEPIRAIFPALVALSVLAFMWGMLKFITRIGGDEKAVTEGKKFMIWGIVALFVMVSVWGILRFFYASFGFIGTFGLPFLPT